MINQQSQRGDIVMVQGVEKRRCRRFEIPGGKGRYRKTGLLVFVRGFSKTYPVVNVSKGGLAFACEEKLGRNKEVIVQLLAPNENPLHLRAQVCWRGRLAGSADLIVGVQFMSFTGRIGHNPLEALDVLRRLDAQYGDGEI